MNWYNSSYRRVLVDDLIAFAWSAPMRDLAKQVDISDVGLRKQLRDYGVPLPRQGHWNRVHAGQKVPSPPKAPPRMPGQTGRVLIEGRLCDLIVEAPAFPIEGPFALSLVPEDLAELREHALLCLQPCNQHKASRKLGVIHTSPAQSLKSILTVPAASWLLMQQRR